MRAWRRAGYALLAAASVMSTASGAQAQFWDRLKERAKEKIDQRLERKTDRAMDATLDTGEQAAEGAVKDAGTGKPAALPAGFPVYAGAKRNASAEADAREYLIPDLPNESAVERSSGAGAFTVDAPIEQVFRFYLDRLGGTEVREIPFPLPRGRVYYDLAFYDFEKQDEMDRGLGAATRAALAKTRKPHRPERWIQTADFRWVRVEPNEDQTILHLELRDDLFDTGLDSKTPRTTIVVTWLAVMNDRDARRHREES